MSVKQVSTHPNGASLHIDQRPESSPARRIIAYVSAESQAQNFNSNKQFRVSTDLNTRSSDGSFWMAKCLFENTVTNDGTATGNVVLFCDPALIAAESVQIRIGGSDQYEAVKNDEIANRLRHNMVRKNKNDYIHKYWGAQPYRYSNKNETITLAPGDSFTFISPLELYFGDIFNSFPSCLYKRIDLEFSLNSDTVKMSNYINFPVADGLDKINMSQRLVIDYHRVCGSPPRSLCFNADFWQQKLYPVVSNASETYNISKDFVNLNHIRNIYVHPFVNSHAGALDTTNSQLAGKWTDLQISEVKLLVDSVEIWKSSPYTDFVHPEMLALQEWEDDNNERQFNELLADTSIYSQEHHPWFRIDVAQILQSNAENEVVLPSSNASSSQKYGKTEIEITTKTPGASIQSPGHNTAIIVQAARVVKIDDRGDGTHVTYAR